MISIRSFIASDYPAAHALWSAIEGLGLNESDTPEAIGIFLERNPSFSAVAVDASGAVVGTILCGHNGRAGSITHLAVAKACRGQRLGTQLVNFALARLAEAKIPRCNIFVYNDNHGGNAFWFKSGWNDPSTWRVLQKHVYAQQEVQGSTSSPSARLRP